MKVVNPIEHDLPPRPRRRRLRTVAVLPTLLTLGNLLCGFAAVYFCMLAFFTADVDPGFKATLNNQVIEHFLPTFISVGGFLIFLGMVFDMMDGRVARMTSSTTNFGGQLDSLADMVTFGIAPAMLMIGLVTVETNRSSGLMMISSRWAWMAGAIFAACCALRLARFNVEHAEGGMKYTSFRGLPSPGAGAVLASLIVLYEHVAEVQSLILVEALPYVALVSGLLMVSRIHYVHIGNTYLRGRRPFGVVIVMLIVLGLLIRYPAQTIAGLVGMYALSGPIGVLWRPILSRLAPGRHRAPDEADSTEETDDSVEKTA